MFTVKIYYASGQSRITCCDNLNFAQPNLTLFGPGEKGEHLELEGTELIYVENASGKTVEVIRPWKEQPPRNPDGQMPVGVANEPAIPA